MYPCLNHIKRRGRDSNTQPTAHRRHKVSHLPVPHPLLPQYKVFEVIVRAQQHRVQHDRTRYRELDAPEETPEAPVAKDVTRMPQEALLVGLEVDGLHAHFQDVGGG